jgi:hypothetical protein
MHAYMRCLHCSPEENYNESVYYNFFDRQKAVGGFVRIGNRVNEGAAEVTVCLYQPDGSVIFMYKKPKISSNNGWCAGGLRVKLPQQSNTTQQNTQQLPDSVILIPPGAHPARARE